MFDASKLPEFQVDLSTAVDKRIVTLDSSDAQNRAYNLLRRRLGNTLDGNGTRIVGVTSATPKAGKSNLTMNLAVSLARLRDRNVVLADLDLRRGSVARLLGLEFESGLDDYLSTPDGELQNLGWRISNAENLIVFPAKTVSSDTGTLLSGHRLDDLFTELRSSPNTIVLVDLPPVLANDDAMTVANKCDGYLFVVAAGENSRRQVDSSLEMLRPARCLGVVLNRYRQGLVDNSGYDYNGYGYAEYFKTENDHKQG